MVFAATVSGFAVARGHKVGVFATVPFILGGFAFGYVVATLAHKCAYSVDRSERLGLRFTSWISTLIRVGALVIAIFAPLPIGEIIYRTGIALLRITS